MTSLLAHLDSLPLAPLALFAFGYLALLGTVLAWLKSRRPAERCDRCGSTWQRTERGAEFHLCQPSRGRAYPSGDDRHLAGLGQRVVPLRGRTGQP